MRPADAMPFAHAISTVLAVAALSAQEALRRRVMPTVAVVSASLLGIFAVAADQAIDAGEQSLGGERAVDVIGALLLGTAAFSDLLLGSIVAVFLTHSAVRGDAERGLLQPLLVRPVSRVAVVAGRTIAGAAIAAAYTLVMWLSAVAVLRVAGGWTLDGWLGAGLAITAAVALVAVAAVAASTVFTAMVAGTLTLVLVALGLTIGQLAQLGEALDLDGLVLAADAVSLALPFEALYRHTLHVLESGIPDVGAANDVSGPFGGAKAASPLLVPWLAAWTAALLAFAAWRAHRADV